MGRYRLLYCRECMRVYLGEGDVCPECLRKHTRLSRQLNGAYGKKGETEQERLKRQDEANRQTVREADALGLTYGQYQALKYLGRL